MHALRVLIPAACLALASCSPRDTQAQPTFAEPNRAPPVSAAQVKMSFAPVVQRAAPAVVNISAKRIVRQQTDPFWSLFGLGVPQARVAASLGSGVIVRADGVVVTNNHVVEGGQEIVIGLADRREFPARILLADPRTDLAVLKIDLPRGEQLPVLPIDDSGESQVGDLVLAIGDPFHVGQTVTNGIISALDRTADPTGEGGLPYIQTDAAINPGNSGGALVDVAGNLMGINTAIYSRSGGSMGIGFAIPANTARQVMESLIRDGRVTRGWIGVEPQDLTPELAQTFNLPIREGVLITGVLQGGPAQQAGIRPGDVVLAVADQAVGNTAQLLNAVAALRPDSLATLSIQRGEQRTTVQVRVGQRPSVAPAARSR